MLNGTVDTNNGMLFVDGELYLPVFALTLPTTFQVDTGADMTCLNPHRLIDAGVSRNDIMDLPQKPGVGVSGRTRLYVTQAIVTFFVDQGQPARYPTLLHIMPLKAPPRIGALLGTDIMQYWQMDCDWPAGTLRFEVPLGPPSPRRYP